MARRIAVAVAAAVLTLAAPAFAQSPQVIAQAGDWTEVTAGGLRAYSSRSGSSSIEIACDEAMTLDHSATGIAVSMGRLLPENAELDFIVDGETIAIPGGSGGVSTRGCPECARKFAQLWPLLRQGSTLKIVASDGRSATFSLRGTAQLMPPEPCPTAS